MLFDLLLQNQASKEIFLISGLTDTSDSYLSYLFKNFHMPEKAQEGEYVCYLFRNGRSDVVYDYSSVLGETIARTSAGDIAIKYLRPEIFLMKYGTIKDSYEYKKEQKSYVYRKKN